MTCAGFFVFWVRPLLTFKTQKFVVIQDWKLGILLRIIQLAVLGYVVWDVVNREGYLETQIPQGAVSVFTQAGDEYTINNTEIAFSSARHCTQPDDYNFYYNEEFTYSDFRCIASSIQGSSQKLEQSLFVDTYFTETKLMSLPGNNKGECSGLIGSSIPEGSKYEGTIQGNCVFSLQSSRFHALPEEISVSYSHRFSTSSAVGLEGVLPTCYLRDMAQENIIATFEEGNDISGLVSEWLEWSQLELDTPMDEQPIIINGFTVVDESIAQPYINITEGLGIPKNESIDDNQLIYPRLRLTGVTLIVKMQYYNYRLSPIKDHISNDLNDIVCVMDIEPVVAWTSAGQQIHFALRDFEDPRFPTSGLPPQTNDTTGLYVTDMYRYGIKFNFQTSGIIGKFSVTSLIQSITSGLVLLAFANTVVTMIALYAMGLRSQLYREFILEKVDWRQEYARFAAQAVVGAYVFNLMDADGSGSLNGVEMYAVLSRLFGHRMTTGQLAAVTDFVLKNGDEDSDKEILKQVNKTADNKNISENTISIDEWMQIFSTNKASIDSMIRTIESEYKNQKPNVTKEMREAEPLLFQGVQKEMKGDSVHPRKSDPEWKELKMHRKV